MKSSERFLRRSEVLAITGVSASTIYKLEKSGEFPQHFMITPRCAGWLSSSVEAWVASKRYNPATLAGHPDVQLRLAKRTLETSSKK